MPSEKSMQIADVAGLFALLVQQVDETFSRLEEQYGEEVRCHAGCDDCCHAVFSVSLMERWAIERELTERLVEDPDLRARLNERGASFREAMKSCDLARPVGGGDADFSRWQLAQWRIRCPMLEDAGQCAIYDARPLTCRIYGLPLSIEGKGHVCGFSGFRKGGDYPTIKMENIHAYLLELSLQFAQAAGAGPDEGRRRFFLHEIIAAFLAA